MKKRLGLLITFVLMAVSLAGCADASTSDTQTKEEKTEKSDEKVVINIADFKQYPAASQIIIADKQGFFEKELEGDNAKANVVKFLNGPAMNEAFAAGDIDFAPMGIMPALSGINNTRGQTIIATDIENFGEGVIVPKDSDIEKIEDLKGKKVGYGVGTSDQIILGVLLEEAGLSIDEDISTVNLADQNDGITALLAGNVDAFFSIEPYLTTYIEEHGVKVIADNSGFASLVVFTARTEFAKEHPELVVDFLKAIRDANEWIEENPQEAVEIVAEETGSDKAGIRATYASLNNTLEISEDDLEIVERTVEFLKDGGNIDSDFEAKDYIDIGFVQKALSE